ncbi:MAG: hypothetical protein O7E54_06565, partial [Planctomycetota bacterium]|nr:hypothetical protein [Planctomycetota bacterium]
MRRLFALCCLVALPALAGDDGPTVWVRAPTEDFLALPDRDGGFLISMEEYRDLIRRAKEAEKRAEERAPLGARLVRGQAVGTIKDDVLALKATYTIVVTDDGPTSVPFRVQGAAVEEISLEGGERVGDELRFEKAGAYVVQATLSARLAKRGDLRSVSLTLPPASGQTVKIALPPDTEGEVGPIVRAFRTFKEAGEVVGYPDGAGRFTFWMRPMTFARNLDPLVSASWTTAAEIAEARTITRTTLDLEVLRAAVKTLELDVAKGQTVSNLSGKTVKNWTVRKGGGDRDTILVNFIDPQEGRIRISLDTELPRDRIETAEIPLVRVPAAVRYLGVVALT